MNLEINFHVIKKSDIQIPINTKQRLTLHKFVVHDFLMYSNLG